LLPECLDDYIAEDNPIRVVDVFVDASSGKRNATSS
jgi:transposase